MLLALVPGCQSGTVPEALMDFDSFEIVDLTHSFNANTIFWPTEEKGFVLEEVFKGTTDGGFYYEANKFQTAEHGGTHLDAPIHFAEGTHSAEEIPLRRLMGNGVVIDVSAGAASDRDYLIPVSAVTEWESEHGTIQPGSVLLFNTGYSSYWPDRERYMGTTETGADAVPKLHFPGLSPALAKWLISEREILSVGIDTPSIDRGQSTDFLAHQILMAKNIPAFENVANVSDLPPTGALVIALPMKIDGGSGGPLRIVALVPKN
ncbi:MAG: cyclase family protein [Rhodothermales bacterium]|nr:cyclase family protein [Rhodothermales bacterium]